MSTREDSPFARWSRLKQAARKAEASDEENHAAEAASQDDAQSGDLELPPSEAVGGTDAAELPEPLPRLEDLTPQSDLSAFLRKDVPAALRNTALKKMWSLDPVIRDYVGPAEYAWDFNKPGSMPGFGALEAGKSVADFLSRTGGFISQDKSAEDEATPQQSAIASVDDNAVALAQDPAASPDRAAPLPAEPAKPDDQPETPQAGPAAASTDQNTPEASPGKSPPSRHGGALPR